MQHHGEGLIAWGDAADAPAATRQRLGREFPPATRQVVLFSGAPRSIQPTEFVLAAQAQLQEHAGAFLAGASVPQGRAVLLQLADGRDATLIGDAMWGTLALSGERWCWRADDDGGGGMAYGAAIAAAYDVETGAGAGDIDAWSRDVLPLVTLQWGALVSGGGGSPPVVCCGLGGLRRPAAEVGPAVREAQAFCERWAAQQREDAREAAFAALAAAAVANRRNGAVVHHRIDPLDYLEEL